MSGISSSMNSIATVVSKDFLDTYAPTANRSQAAKIRTARLVTFASGACLIQPLGDLSCGIYTNRP